MTDLERLNFLERQFDGPIPAYLLSPPGVQALQSARGSFRFYTAQVRFQLSALRVRRTLGLPVHRYMLNDLSLYWQQRRKYQAKTALLSR